MNSYFLNSSKPTIKEKINNAIDSGKLDELLSQHYVKILDNDDPELLDWKVEYIAEGYPIQIPKGMKRLVEKDHSVIKYKAKTTYRVLLNHVQNRDFTYFGLLNANK